MIAYFLRDIAPENYNLYVIYINLSQEKAMDSSRDAQKFHDDVQLCQYLLGSITTTHSLEIRPSGIPQAGSGLFTLNDIPEGTEIYRSSPVVECVADGLVDGVCDFCYANTLSRVHPSGRFRTKDDAPLEMIPCRAGCGKCYYCSKVSTAYS